MLLTGKLLLIIAIMIVKVRKVKTITKRSFFKKTLVLLLFAASCWITAGCLQPIAWEDLGDEYEEERLKKPQKKVIQLCYAILELDVRRKTDTKEITKAYRKVARKYHPDRGGDKEVFQAVNKANEILQCLSQGSILEDLNSVEGCEHVAKILEQALELKDKKRRYNNDVNTPIVVSSA
jgi:hypothetical protein